MAVRATWRVILVAIALTACAAPAESAAPSVSAAPVETSASEPPPPTEQEGPPSLPPCQEGAICDGPVAGEYTSTSTGATVTFTVPGGDWLGQRDIDEVGFAVFQEDPTGYAGLAVTSFSGDVFAASCDPSQIEQVETSPAAFVEWLSGREGITAGEPIETTVGGRPAVQVDVTSALPAECQEPPWIWLWSLPVVGDFHLNDGETARFYAVEGADAMVIIVIEAFPGVDWDAFLAEAMTIVDSMTIDGGS